MTDEITFEPVDRPARSASSEAPTGTKEPGLPKQWGLREPERWREAAGEAAWWGVALAVASGLIYGLVWGAGAVGANDLERDWVLTGMLYVSVIAWVVGGGVAIVSVWLSIEEPSWWQRGWWAGAVLSGFSGVVPYTIALGGLLLLLPVGGPASLVPSSLGLGGDIVRSAVFLFLGGGLVTTGGVLAPPLLRNFRWPVLAGLSTSLAYAFTVRHFIATWGAPDLDGWGGSIIGGFACVPVVGLVLWSYLGSKADRPKRSRWGIRYLIGVVLLWGGLEGITVGLHTAAVAVWG